MEQMEEKRLYGALTVYRERGAYLHRLEQFDKAKASYDEAFKSAPEDVQLLIGRSQVCADAVQPHQAFADAELALKCRPRNMKARNVQAQAMFAMSDFESSLVMNYRGSRLRKKPPYFYVGINQGLETMENCVGKKAGNVMLDSLPIIRSNPEQHTDADEPVKTLHNCRIPRKQKKVKLSQLEFRRHHLLSRVLAMKYLGPMAYDKFFLEKLTEDRRLISANTRGTEELKNLASHALRSLTATQDMLHVQRPYYSIKFAEKTFSKRQEMFKKEMLKREQITNMHTADRLIRSIEISLQNRSLMEVISKADHMKLFLDTKTARNFPDKEMYVDRLYRAVGRSYLKQHRLSYTLSKHGIRRRVAFLMGIPIGRPTSFDSVIATYPIRCEDVKMATERALKELDMCENSYMRCWLTYELSRLLNMQGSYPLSKFYAKRCQREAQKINSVSWWLNGCFALLSGDMKQGNVNEVRIAVAEAYEWSKKMQDPENVQAFLLKCAEIAAEIVSTDESKEIRVREKQILRVMDDKSRVKTEVLLKRIETLPAGRRFRVLPRPDEAKDPRSERRRRCQRGLTVVTGPAPVLSVPHKSSIPGFQKFDL